MFTPHQVFENTDISTSSEAVSVAREELSFHNWRSVSSALYKHITLYLTIVTLVTIVTLFGYSPAVK